MTGLLERIVAGEEPVGVLLSGEMVLGSGPEEKVVSRIDGSPVGVIATAGPAEVRAAYEAAAAAAPKWGAMGPGPRSEILHRAAALFRERVDVIGRIISADMGKPLSEARRGGGRGGARLLRRSRLPQAGHDLLDRLRRRHLRWPCRSVWSRS